MECLLGGVSLGSPISITWKDIDEALRWVAPIIQTNSPSIMIFFNMEISHSNIGSLLLFDYDLILPAMHFYAIQVKTCGEEQFMRLFRALHPELPFLLHFPRRRIDIRRRGAIRQTTAAVFPGYIFIEAESKDILAHQQAFRRTGGFFR